MALINSKKTIKKHADIYGIRNYNCFVAKSEANNTKMIVTILIIVPFRQVDW